MLLRRGGKLSVLGREWLLFLIPVHRKYLTNFLEGDEGDEEYNSLQ